MRLFGELSDLSEENMRSIPYDEYFDEMDLTEEEKEKRKQFSREFEDVMLFIFTLFSVMRQYGSINKQYIIGQLQSRYSEIVLKYMEIDKYLDDYIADFAIETVDTTIKHIDEPFYLSNDRSILISENEANGIFNYGEFSEAIRAGKKRKQWVDVRDKKERETHREVGGTVIPIEDTFIVGNSLMLFPKDTSYGAEMKEIANCRCTIKYF